MQNCPRGFHLAQKAPQTKEYLHKFLLRCLRQHSLPRSHKTTQRKLGMDPCLQCCVTKKQSAFPVLSTRGYSAAASPCREMGPCGLTAALESSLGTSDRLFLCSDCGASCHVLFQMLTKTRSRSIKRGGVKRGSGSWISFKQSDVLKTEECGQAFCAGPVLPAHCTERCLGRRSVLVAAVLCRIWLLVELLCLPAA